ncbi:hypothetical protein NONI108955_22365 [Nocardia ninae]|uniref:Uncharacterized protein n=1 Tax=Nocardia ninae NBRC 108245 TaxID=1210091 RepID=A0A511MCS5_9NOCA|nr:hypothetical protein [Nocardia ninae]GEM38474.1 hypothetical protein NN4_29930 [Nocardia ninae NBRC 108245]
MAAPEVVLAYINALKWPVVVCAAVIYLRDLRDPIAKLVDRIKSGSISVAGFTATIEAESERVAEEAQQAAEAPRMAEAEDHITATDEATVVKIPPLAISTAKTLRPEKLQILRTSAERLRSYSNEHARVSFPSAVQKYPGAVVLSRGSRLNELIAEMLEAAPVGFELWPGTPSDLADVFRKLKDLHTRAEIAPVAVSPSAAANFVKSARTFAGLYATFLGGVIDTVDSESGNRTDHDEQS